MAGGLVELGVRARRRGLASRRPEQAVTFSSRQGNGLARSAGRDATALRQARRLTATFNPTRWAATGQTHLNASKFIGKQSGLHSTDQHSPDFSSISQSEVRGMVVRGIERPVLDASALWAAGECAR